jgi:dinuclear metal center YbgI/SA1388 family protein
MAPPTAAAEWDNVGLLIGDPLQAISGVMLAIDLTGDVLAEAVEAGTEMVVAYHPPIFTPIHQVTADASPEVYGAARAGLAVYSPHTALDAAPGGTNDVLAEAVGIVDARPLEPATSGGRCKVVVFVPADDVERVSAAAFAAGGGRIGNYTECSFRSAGAGTFLGGPGASPAIGRRGRREMVDEYRLEVIADAAAAGAVVAAIRAAHSYETPAIDVYALQPMPDGFGMGRVGPLARPVKAGTLVARVKRALGVRRVLLAGPKERRVRVAACCAGSGGEVFRRAVEAGADAYVTGEMRHHDALAAAGAGLTVICTGHSHSERLTLHRLADRLHAALPSLKVSVARSDRDPFEIL